MRGTTKISWLRCEGVLGRIGRHGRSQRQSVRRLCQRLSASVGRSGRPYGGRIVKAHDDLLDATRYGVMMLRFAKEVKDGKIKRRRPAVVKGVEYDVFNY